MKKASAILILFSLVVLVGCDKRKPMNDDKAYSIFNVQKKILEYDCNWSENFYFKSDNENGKLYLYNADKELKVVNYTDTKKQYILNDMLYENNLLKDEKTMSEVSELEIENFINRKQNFHDFIKDIISDDKQYTINGIVTNFEVITLSINTDVFKNYKYLKDVNSASISIYFDNTYRLTASISLIYENYTSIETITLFMDSSSRNFDSMIPTDLKNYKS